MLDPHGWAGYRYVLKRPFKQRNSNGNGSSFSRIVPKIEAGQQRTLLVLP